MGWLFGKEGYDFKVMWLKRWDSMWIYVRFGFFFGVEFKNIFGDKDYWVFFSIGLIL